MREGLGEWICTKAMARKKCRKWQRIIPKAIVHFQGDFQKPFFSSEKHFVLSSNKKARTSKTKRKSWVNPNKTLVMRKIFERESSFEEKI